MRAVGVTHWMPSLWRTFAVGGVPKDELLRQLVAEVIEVNQLSRDLVARGQFVTSPSPRAVAFGRATVRQFGFTDGPTTPELLARVREVGSLCQPEDALYIRRAFNDQPNGDVCWIAMEPIADSDGDLYVFYVERDDDGQRWLITDYISPDRQWILNAPLVFRLRKVVP